MLFRSPRSLSSDGGGGKSGLHGNTVPGNARRGRPQGKCNRKQTAGASSDPSVRVKGCGKSAPRSRRRDWHCKPHREQDRIGTAGRRFACGQARFRVVVRVGCARRPATGVPDEWSSIASSLGHRPWGRGGDRTRLTDRLAFLLQISAKVEVCLLRRCDASHTMVESDTRIPTNFRKGFRDHETSGQ